MIPRLHLVTDDEVLRSPGFETMAVRVLRTASEALERDGRRGDSGAVVALHVRGPRASGRRIYDLTRSLLDRTSGMRIKLFVNDRLDVALSLPVAGVHLGARSLPVHQARSVTRHWSRGADNQLLLGVSVKLRHASDPPKLNRVASPQAMDTFTESEGLWSRDSTRGGPHGEFDHGGFRRETIHGVPRGKSAHGGPSGDSANGGSGRASTDRGPPG